jgi:hypothetical protein
LRATSWKAGWAKRGIHAFGNYDILAFSQLGPVTDPRIRRTDSCVKHPVPEINRGRAGSAKHHPLFSLNTVIKIQQSRHWDQILSFLSGFTHLFSRLRYAASRHDLSDLKAAFASKDEPSLWIASFPIIQTCCCITHPLIILGSTRSKTSSPNFSAALSLAESSNPSPICAASSCNFRPASTTSFAAHLYRSRREYRSDCDHAGKRPKFSARNA